MERLARRGTGFNVMREAIRNPDKVELGYDGRKMAVKDFGNYTYVIVYDQISPMKSAPLRPTCDTASSPMRRSGTLPW
jgi:hypothetical protein